MRSAGKRQRVDHEATPADAPPPVRSGRGRVREDNPVQRGKANTTRPASKHVDEYQGGAPKRFQNSSRAPSKHVDDYQNAPVVRRVVQPADLPRRGDDTGSPGGGGPPAPGDEMQRGAGRPFNGNAGPGQGGFPPQGPGNMPPQGHGNMPPQGHGNMPPQGHGNMPPQGHGNMHGHGNMPQGHGNMPPQGHGNMHMMQQHGFQGGQGAQSSHPPHSLPRWLQAPLPAQPVRSTALRWQVCARRWPTTCKA